MPMRKLLFNWTLHILWLTKNLKSVTRNEIREIISWYILSLICQFIWKSNKNQHFSLKSLKKCAFKEKMYITLERNCRSFYTDVYQNIENQFPINFWYFLACQCNGQAKECNHKTGRCHCTTKGIIGEKCERCDIVNHYYGDPVKSSCYCK